MHGARGSQTKAEQISQGPAVKCTFFTCVLQWLSDHNCLFQHQLPHRHQGTQDLSILKWTAVALSVCCSVWCETTGVCSDPGSAICYCWSLGKLFNFSKSFFPHLCNGSSSTNHQAVEQVMEVRLVALCVVGEGGLPPIHIHSLFLSCTFIAKDILQSPSILGYCKMEMSYNSFECSFPRNIPTQLGSLRRLPFWWSPPSPLSVGQQIQLPFVFLFHLF